jgi:D-serine dehydratase
MNSPHGVNDQRFDPLNKGIPFGRGDLDDWHLFDRHTTLPAAVLLRSAIERNSAAMAQYCERSGVSLAPHGKTTMSPELFRLQMRDGAWAITAANVHQARVMQHAGVDRVLIANEVTAPGDIDWLADRVARGFEVMCYVDSLAGVDLLHEGLSAHLAAGRCLGVLVELGIDGGRTGSRSVPDALEVARAVSGVPTLRLAGVSGFEGIIVATDDATATERVDDFLNRIVELAESIIDEGFADHLDEFVVSAGGSVFFDQVVATLGNVRSSIPIRVVVRSGCYLSHDDGVIDELSPLGAHPRVHGDVFHAALEIWAPVLSHPEPGRLILGAGKRDLSTDSLFPIAKKWVRRNTRDVIVLDTATRAIKVDDQHAYLEVDPSWQIAVGDYVGLGISHPCTTFDKWRVMAVVDDDYAVVDLITTRF